MRYKRKSNAIFRLNEGEALIYLRRLIIKKFKLKSIFFTAPILSVDLTRVHILR